MSKSSKPQRWEGHPEDLWLHVVDVFTRAQAGELEPFAQYIEDGHSLTPDMQLWLAAYLRGDLKWGRGRKLSIDQMSEDVRVYRAVEDLKQKYDLNKREAMDRYLDDNPDFNLDTLKKIWRRGKGYFENETQIGPRYK